MLIPNEPPSAQCSPQCNGPTDGWTKLLIELRVRKLKENKKRKKICSFVTDKKL